MDHNKLFIPGPTEVRPEILDAQTRWMIGHRSPECADLIASIESRLKEVFFTSKRVYLCPTSGTGLQEAAVRNCSHTMVLNCVNGAFGDRWRKVTEANGKRNEVLEVDWGRPILPGQVAEKLHQAEFDAITVVHNETSTGVLSPVQEIARAVRESPGGENVMILVDSVSGLGGTRVESEAWDIDVVLTSSQKALALPPGLAFCAVSDRALDKARQVDHRGYYLDFLILEEYLQRNQTPVTPPVSLLFALDKQLEYILSEGMERRFERHLFLRDRTIAWARDKEFTLFASPGYESPTVSCIDNTLGIDVRELLAFLQRRGFVISNGYGSLKGLTFRIAHMGDLTYDELDNLLIAMDGFFTQP